jgi:hypothetical protein
MSDAPCWLRPAQESVAVCHCFREPQGLGDAVHETRHGLAHFGLFAVPQIKATRDAPGSTKVGIRRTKATVGSSSGAGRALRLAPLVALLAAV